MNKDAHDWNDSGYYSCKYFTGNILPPVIKISDKTIDRMLFYEQHDEIELLFIRRGIGHIIVNGESHPLRRGIYIWLNPYHFHRIAPDKGERMEVVECHVNTGTYLFINECPYYNSDPINFRDHLYIIQLTEEVLLAVEALWAELLKERRYPDSFSNPASMFLLMKLFGLFGRYQGIE